MTLIYLITFDGNTSIATNKLCRSLTLTLTQTEIKMDDKNGIDKIRYGRVHRWDVALERYLVYNLCIVRNPSSYFDKGWRICSFLREKKNCSIARYWFHELMCIAQSKWEIIKFTFRISLNISFLWFLENKNFTGERLR